MRKSPIVHQVHSFQKSNGTRVGTYLRGHGIKKIANPSLISKAKRHFGITTNPEKAGYLLPDGSFLDFSEGEGCKWSDHRAIKQITPDNNKETAVEQFRKAGEIRFTLKSREIDLEKSSSVPMTQKQWKAIEKILQSDKMKEYIFVDSVGPSYTSSYSAFYKQDPHSQAPPNFITLEQLKSKLGVD